MSSTPLLMCSGMPCVDATVGGTHVRLLIDTGDVEAILSDSAGAKLGLESKPVTGADGKPADYRSATIRGLRIGTSTLDDLPTAVGNLKALMGDHVPEADGSLTYPVFKNRLLTLDFVRKTLSVSEPLDHTITCHGHCGPLLYPTFGKRGPNIVVTSRFAVDGNAVTTQVDTLYTGSLLIYPHAVDALHLQDNSHSTEKTFFPYTDGGVDMVKSAALDISFDGRSLAKHPALYFATPAVHAPDGMFDGTVGLAVLAKSVVTFDFHDNWISINRAPIAAASPNAAAAHAPAAI